MKKLLLVTIAVAAVVGVTAAQAEVTTNTKTPIAQTVFVPCANGGVGEFIDLSGELHTLITSTINDNHVSGKYHYQPQGVSAIGQITGDTYRATGGSQDKFSGNLTNDQYETTYVNNFRMIGPGPGNNFLVHEVSHLTINANGTTTVDFDNLSTECK